MWNEDKKNVENTKREKIQQYTQYQEQEQSATKKNVLGQQVA